MSATHKSVRPDRDHTECKAASDTFSLIGDKWTPFVIGTLQHGSLRYAELQRELDGISQRMLTLTLKRLEAEGVVTRTVHPTVPPRVEYALTEAGRKLIGALGALRDWTREHGRAFVEARAKDAQKAEE